MFGVEHSESFFDLFESINGLQDHVPLQLLFLLMSTNNALNLSVYNLKTLVHIYDKEGGAAANWFKITV